MKKIIPWFVAATALLAFSASFSELQRMRGRFGEVTRHQFHDHQEVRQFMIRAALLGLDQPIIVIGDSVTEMSRLPENVRDRPVVNAGIGGATISDFEALAPRLLQDSQPSIIVIALGANDAGSNTVQRDYTALLQQLKKLTPKLLSVAVMPLDNASLINTGIGAAARSEGVQFLETSLPEGSILPDGIHLTASGSRAWVGALVAAIAK